MPSLSDCYFRLKNANFFSRVKERICLKNVLDAIEEQISEEKPALTFVQLPPGYGKTAIPYSLWMWALTSEDTHIERSIHVLPLRSIVEDVWSRFLAGLNALGFSEEEILEVAGAEFMFTHLSPFFLKSFIATTIDTFALLTSKFPPYEGCMIAYKDSYGHYEIARGALLSAAVVFDEAHLLIDEKSKGYGMTLTTLLALTIALLRWRVPIIFMTATLPQSLRQALEKWISSRETTARIRSMSYGEGDLRDKDFEDETSSIKFETRLYKDDGKYLKDIVETFASFNRVLIVANTIERARRIYEELCNRGLNPILLHAKFTRRDRENKLRVLNEDRWLCISTQVIEAGVDISSNAVFSDAAPLCSLVQRIGRCCRPSHTNEYDEGKVSICVSDNSISGANKVYAEDIIDSSLKALKKIGQNFNWHSYFNYMKLLEMGYENYSPKNIEGIVNYPKFMSMLDLLLHPYFTSKDTFRLILSLGSLTRDEPLVPSVVCKHDEIDWKNYEKIAPLFIPLEFSDLRRILKKTGKLKIIERKKNGKYYISERSELPRLINILSGAIIAVHIPPELYDKERGLLL